MTSVSASRIIEKTYSGTVIHSMKRTDDCPTAYANPIPITSHTACDLYTFATAVGVSVCPAE